jgi:Asp-tRNA(Asn)/Glu-tRNA(Gln) amidotransferase A subunit family amidase
MSGGKILQELTATEVRDYLAAGQSDVASFYDQQLAFAQGIQERIQAFADLDERVIRLQAGHSRDERARGEPLGRLYGVPIAVKDIIDTIDFPTAYGSPIHAGRYAVADATVVRRLRDAGAVIFGKTVTTEFATFHPGPTRNPHNPEHTPGGSSSGSAAAVAAGMVPLALGSQTNGSVIRPAAFCGVYGFKPTHGLIPRSGILKLSRALDHVGLFARTLEDVALLAEQLVGQDDGDPDTRPHARIPFQAVAGDEPPLAPQLAFVKGPAWERAEPEAKEAFAELVGELGERVQEVELPPSAQRALDWHRTIMEAEMAANLDLEWEKGRERLSEKLRSLLARGREANALEYQKALARIPILYEGFGEIFERCDAILTPSAPGTAPRGLGATGDPAFCTLWTFLGTPALNLPLMRGANGLPLGVQLVGPRHDDARLLRTARWLVAHLESERAR